jgi:broad specificity phosphatase PhoE
MEMMTTILLIRHGETQWNRSGIFRGSCDVPLNDAGRRQARLLGQVLACRQIDAAYTSALSRASETAQLALGDRDIEARADGRFVDFSYGHWQGLAEADVARRWPEELAAWKSKPHTLRVPGGDTLGEVYDRAFEGMEELAARHGGGTIALFAHRVVNKLLVLGALGLGLDRFGFIRQDNACFNEFQRSAGGYVIVCLNDTSHLRQTDVGPLSDDF